MSDDKLVKTEAEWMKILTPEQYAVLRKKGTESAFRGQFWDHHEPGVYRCSGCGAELFDSRSKFDSGTGWPSFWAPAGPRSVEPVQDHSHGMVRTEVVCRRCGGHLGHLFTDGPRPTGLRYCINSVSLRFEKRPARK
ncbi:MAG: peptide-methionine (R)-S-oxide reductase MsrB [Candidatus Riflebacteria bacterium]|nr:peptide-methionine (R)-S-oxide reductase MsrB [Candidatus Riflebacteria bacterium]